MKTKCMSCGGSMKKMAVGGTTTKRIIKKSTGGMYGIPQENLGTSGQYGFAQKGGVIKAVKKVVKKITRPTLRKAQNGGMTKADPYGVSLVNKTYKTKGSNKLGGKTNMGPTKIVPKKVDPIAPKASKTRTIERNGTFEMKKGGSTKATKFAALAPPYNKATFADRIVGAKKNASSKKLPKAQLGGLLKLAIRATKPLSKTLKPVAKKIVSKSKTTATKKFNYPKDKVKSMFPRVAEDVKKFNSETNPQKLFERKTIKEQMKQWDKAAELKQQKKYPVLKNKN